MMVAISWELAIFSVLFLPVVALLIGSIVKKLRHPARTNQQRMGEMVSTLDESLSGIKVIKSYNATEYIKQKYYAISADLARLTLSMARRQQLALSLIHICIDGDTLMMFSATSRIESTRASNSMLFTSGVESRRAVTRALK